jgi:hypothetical protein
VKGVVSRRNFVPGRGAQAEADGLSIMFFKIFDERINAELDGLIQEVIPGGYKVGDTCNTNQNSPEILFNT